MYLAHTDDSFAKHVIIKYDMMTNSLIYHDFRLNIELGELSFVARNNSSAEDDGYLVGFIYNNLTDTSDFIVIDAQKLSRTIATVKLPVRVPHGLHGSWN